MICGLAVATTTFQLYLYIEVSFFQDQILTRYFTKSHSSLVSSKEISLSFIHTWHPAQLEGLPWIFRRLLGQQDGRDFVPAEKKTCVSDMILLLHSTRPPKRRVRHFTVDFPICGKFGIQCASLPTTETLLRLLTSEARKRHKECTQQLIWAIRRSAQSAWWFIELSPWKLKLCRTCKREREQPNSHSRLSICYELGLNTRLWIPLWMWLNPATKYGYALCQI